MRLKNIEMQGFKSFADKIYLDFNSGITAIVGPNGSGKSNISDAIRWVMGEQSVKSLRGSRMEDVIFAGTEKRKALGFAEVTLTLDNTDGYFSLDFPEITVTRRVYRSGDGEYYINKTLCRLKDIHELFMDTGLGRDGYSIIGQGKIDSILSTKSEDRRQIFEEAAGISKYKYRKLEAERKLVQTVDNLTRVKDILSELEGQLGPLERQSEKAKRYLILRDELRGIDIAVSIINIDRIKEESAKLSQDLELLNAQISEIAASLEETDSAISEMYSELTMLDEQAEKINSDERDLLFKISESEKESGILRNDAEHNRDNIDRLKAEILNISESTKVIESDIKQHKSKLEELGRESVQNKSEIEEITALISAANIETSEKGGALESLKSRIMDITAKIGSLKVYIENSEILKDSFVRRKTDILSERSERAKSVDELTQKRDSAAADERNFNVKLEEVIAERKKNEENIRQTRAEFEKLSVQRNNTILELGRRRSRRTMLIDMEREMEGYAKGVKGVMTAYKGGRFGNAKIYGPLAQLIKTDKKYITAIETALGAASQNIVTETESEAKLAIAYLKEKHLGRATFLPVSSIRTRNFDPSSAARCEGYISTAAQLVECDEKYRNIVGSFLASTVICDNIDNAVVMARKNGHKFRIVTLGGDVIQAGGAMTGGSAVKTTGSLSRTGEIDSLAEEIEKLKVQTEREEKRLAALSESISNSTDLVEKITAAEQEIRSNAVRAASDFERYSALVESINSSDAQLGRELDDIEQKLGEIDADLTVKNAEIEEITNERSALEKGAEGAQAEFSRATDENERLSERLTRANIRRSTLLKDTELENERIAALNASMSDRLDDIKIKNGGIETLKKRNEDIAGRLEQLGKQCDEYRVRADECKSHAQTIAESRKKTEDEIRKRQSEVKDTQEQKFALSQRASKFENRLAKLMSDRESIVNRMWEDYELTYSDAAELERPEGFEYSSATVRIKELKDSIRALGNINIDSIEEYKNVKERFDFLTVQTSDLEKSKAELDSVIEEMMDIMQKNFAEQFKIINIGFNKVFSELFGGGSAHLSLTEPDNVLESGIEIEAQPPGKKLQSLTLLSGGERAFTAIALLFAILDVRPTPFCILDEIEAALDDANVYRYADYLHKYSSKTQFIVVTHRRGTMEAANILYGVTMQEKGISKLLSLNIDEVNL